jgi:hypothetical protein
VILGVLAVAGAAGLAVYAALTAARVGAALGAVGGLAAVVLAVALVLRVPALVGVGLLVLGAEYAAYFGVRGHEVDSRAPLYGVAFLVVAELAYATLELRAGKAAREVTARRVAALALLALGSVAVGTLALAAAATPIGGGVGLEAVGVAAAVVLVFALGRVAVRSR